MRHMSAALRAAVVISGLALTPFATAAVLSWTGSELLTEPRATFPTQTPAINGTSLVFGTYDLDLAKLLTIDLGGLLSPNPQGQINFTATFGLTRLPCVGGCAGAPEDWDFHIFATDGTSAVGGGSNDPNEIYGLQSQDQGSTVAYPTFQLLFTSALFPAIGESAEVHLAFTLRPGLSKVGVEAFGTSANYQPGIALNPALPLQLALVRDNDDGEQYQLNFLQINFPNRAPEPATLSLLGLALAGVGFARRRKLH